MFPVGEHIKSYNEIPLVEVQQILDDTSNTNADYVTNYLSENNTNMNTNSLNNDLITDPQSDTTNSKFSEKNQFSELTDDSSGPEEDPVSSEPKT